MDPTTPYTVFVNSTDKFEDCWLPFFKLFSHYWPNCSAKIILNTETKSYDFPSLNIQSTQVSRKPHAKKQTWGHCLIKGLEQVRTPLVLYLQEDYFLKEIVDHKTIDDLAVYMMEREITRTHVHHIGLTSFDRHGPFGVTPNPLLWQINSQDPFFISLQAGLWQTQTLKSLVSENDTPWGFEAKGQDLNKRTLRFYTLNKQEFQPSTRQVISYDHTGVIRGRWNPDIVPLFTKHNLDIDFNIRGFYTKENQVPSVQTIRQRLLRRLKQYLPKAKL